MATALTEARAPGHHHGHGASGSVVGTRDHRPPSPYLAVRAVPLIGSLIFAVVVVNFTLWWDPVTNHVDAWWVPGDFWHTFFTTSAFVHGHWGAVYDAQTGLIAFPGVLVMLSPAVALAQALHLSIGVPYTAVSTPTAWLVVEPFDLLAGCTVLFAIDAVARRLEVSARRRSLLAAAEMIALWDLLAQNWHPEDALAVSFALWALLAAFDGRWSRSGWLLGVGVAFQPLVVLVLAAVLGLAPRRRTVGLLVRAGLPGAVLLAGPLIANPSATLRAVLDQPNHPLLDHPTPWMHFAPRLGDGVVAAGPTRLVAVAVAVVVSWMVCRRTRRLDRIVWIVAVCF
ncbi:MAG TPA: hypothetical protein VN771_08095, partial [Candidatus Baltobacteraceae bacterium]|nr:hypothetical protein [Candidatus Baltobacteraceae bacterium]